MGSLVRQRYGLIVERHGPPRWPLAFISGRFVTPRTGRHAFTVPSFQEVHVSSSSVRLSLGRLAVLTLLAGSLVLPAAAVAQGTATVRGKVTDTDGPVVAAQVVVAGTRLGAVTQPTGEYVITNVPAGAQTLRVMRIGYSPTEKQVTVPASGELR